MAGLRFQIDAEEPPDRAREAVRKVLGGAGYLEESPRGSAAVFAKGAGTFRGAWSPAHKVLVTASASGTGSIVVAEVLVSRAIAIALRTTVVDRVREILRSALREAFTLLEGVVSKDGTRVDFRTAIAADPFAPIKNTHPDLSRGAHIGGIATAAFFFGLLAFTVVVEVLGEHAWRIVALAVIVCGFFGSLGVMLAIYPRITRRLPVSVAPRLDGFVMYFRGRPPVPIPWDRVQGLSQMPGAPGIWRLHWTDEDGKKRYVRLMEAAARSVWRARQSVKEMTAVRATPTWQAYNLVPPGNRVFFSERGLTDDELQYRKLARRWLPSGPPVPVYVTAEDDAKLVREAVERLHPPFDDLKRIALTAAEQRLWGLGADLLRKASGQAPEDEGIAYHLAGCLMKMERSQEALAVVDEFLRGHPQSSSCHTMRAMIAMKLERPEEALYHVGQAVDADPNNLEALEVWFDIVAAEGGVAQAVAELDYLASRKSDAWGPFLILGSRLAASGQSAQGLPRLEQAHRLGANDDTLVALSGALLRERKVDDALRVLESARASRAIAAPALLNLASAYAARGELQRAMEILDTIAPEMGASWVAAADQMRRRLRR